MKRLFHILLSCLVLTGASSCATSENEFVYVEDGVLYEPDGSELDLWGVNFQPCLSWEYNARLKPLGYELSEEVLLSVVDNNIDDIVKMGVSVIRCHLTPSDFTDEEGNLVETPYLTALDYLVSEASKRGLYLTFALVNIMGKGYCPDSIFNQIEKRTRPALVHDKNVVKCTQNYVRQLMARVNPYTGTEYARESSVAYWELINEPQLFKYQDLQSMPEYWKDYQDYLRANVLEDTDDSYWSYRKQLVISYIDDMVFLIRSAGAAQPICWCLNWHRFRKKSTDLFAGVAESKADVVSVCNYPGQGLAGENYYRNPIELTDVDFSSWFEDNYKEMDGYGWLLSDMFKSKAKVSYEFETFFNQSAYLYPIQALYFRALGLQSAAMWTYTIDEAARYFAGSHFLNMDCTPGKSASFIVAGEIFRTVPRFTPLAEQLNEQVTSTYAISKSHDVSIYSDSEKLLYSNDISSWCPVPCNPEVKRIVGVGSSPLVDYSGSGIYFIEDRGDELIMDLRPDHKWASEPWNNIIKPKTLVSELDFDSPNTISISLSKWGEGNFTLYRFDGPSLKKEAEIQDLNGLTVIPGLYVIKRN